MSWQQKKAAFWVELDRHGGNVAAAARAAEVNANTAYAWMRNAGVRAAGNQRTHPGHPGRTQYTDLRAAGMSRRQAAAAAGLSVHTAAEWDRGVVRTGRAGGRVRTYPHRGWGRVGYKVKVNPTSAASSVALSAVEAVLHPRFLTLLEREQIADRHRRGESARAIARALGRAASTITRELKNHSQPATVADPSASAARPYWPHAAQRAWTASRARPKHAKLAGPSRLRDYVQDKLERCWSPEQISHALAVDFPDDEDMRAAPETIYQALYLQARGGLRREVAAALRTGRTARKPRTNPAARTSRFTDPMVMISERPAEVEDRAVPGHWEGDLILGTGCQSAIVTLVERSTRYVLLGHLPGGHHAEAVRDVLTDLITTLPAHLRRSLTWDQGAEMAAHRSFSVASGVPVYFCDPRSPWQRGSNENTVSVGVAREGWPGTVVPAA